MKYGQYWRATKCFLTALPERDESSDIWFSWLSSWSNKWGFPHQVNPNCHRMPGVDTHNGV